MTEPSVEYLRDKILKVITSSKMGVSDLMTLLEPVDEYISSRQFTSNVRRIVEILTTDRNKDNVFDIEDLYLLSKDTLAITSLITAILLALASIPQIDIKYDPVLAEEITFKLLAYVFFVVIPSHTKTTWTSEEKIAVLDLILIIYNFVRSSEIIKTKFKEIIEWFKIKTANCSSKWCFCTKEVVNKQEVFEERVEPILTNLRIHVDNIRDQKLLRQKVLELEHANVRKKKN